MLGRYQNKGEVRTDMHCHACSKGFIALLDHRIENEQIIECPNCGHMHYRRVKNGVVTDERFDSDPNTLPVKCRKTWKHDVLKMKTTTASEFLRNSWLNFDK